MLDKFKDGDFKEYVNIKFHLYTILIYFWTVGLDFSYSSLHIWIHWLNIYIFYPTVMNPFQFKR